MTLGEAKTAGEILGVLARREWYLKHKDKPELRNECPDSMIPAAPDLAAWLPECPEGAQAEANRLLVDFFDAVRWFAMQRLASIPFEVAATGMVTDSDGTLVEAEVFPRGAKVEPVLILSGLAHLVETWRWEVVRTGQADRIMMGVVEEGFGVVGSGKMGAVLSIGLVHLAWIALPEPRTDHPLGPIVRACMKRPPTVRANLRVDPVMPAIQVSQSPERERGQLFGGLTPKDPPALPLLPGYDPDPVASGVVVPLLELADASGVVSMARGRGAPLDLRLTVESFLSVPPELRGGSSARIVIEVEELLGGLFPLAKGRGKRSWFAERGRQGSDWRRTRQALEVMGTRWIPWQSGGRWWPLLLRGLPSDTPALSDKVVIEVALPPGSGSGPVIDRPALQREGLVSGPRYRAMIGVNTIAWVLGVTRMRKPGIGGLWVGDPDRYPLLSTDDRRRLVFGPSDRARERGKAADEAIRNTPGLVVVSEAAFDVKTGKKGWRVVPADAARAIRKAKARDPKSGGEELR